MLNKETSIHRVIKKLKSFFLNFIPKELDDLAKTGSSLILKSNQEIRESGKF